MKTPPRHRTLSAIALSIAFSTSTPTETFAQSRKDYRVDVAWNRLYDYDEVVEIAKRLQRTWPELLSLESIGKSHEGRDLWLLTLNNPDTGTDRSKPAFYSDANIHGNEVQGTETILYLVCQLMRELRHGSPQIT